MFLLLPTSTGKPSAPRSSPPPTADTIEGCMRGSKLPPAPLASKQPCSNPRPARPSSTRASNCSDGSRTIPSFAQRRISSQTLPSTPASHGGARSPTHRGRAQQSHRLFGLRQGTREGRYSSRAPEEREAHPPAVPAQAAVPMLGTTTHPPGYERCQHRHPLQEQGRPQRL